MMVPFTRRCCISELTAKPSEGHRGGYLQTGVTQVALCLHWGILWKVIHGVVGERRQCWLWVLEKSYMQESELEKPLKELIVIRISNWKNCTFRVWERNTVDMKRNSFLLQCPFIAL
jgi:hypothetical protein